MLIYQKKNAEGITTDEQNKLYVMINSSAPASGEKKADITLTKTGSGVEADFSNSAPIVSAVVQGDSAGQIKVTTGDTQTNVQIPGWDDKLTKNTAITAGTYCKISYDTKGLVTAGASLTADDIPELSAAKITSGTFNTARIPDISSTYSVVGHTHSYAGSSSAGGAATSANKLNTNAGSTIQPVYFSNGIPVATSFSLAKSVPADAKFTDTTYSAATTTTAGLMSAGDKVKLESITVSTGATKSVTVESNTLTFGSNAFNSTAIPTAYIQSASVNGNTLTLTDQSGSTITYTASTTDRYQAPDYSTGLKISTGNGGINSLYIPFATRADSQFCLLDEDGRRISVAEVITHITTCFRGDTSYVTMYDGTTKLISDVKAGDSVLGYDVNKQDYCEAIVLDNIKTGEANAFDCYVFEDGTTIDIYGDDSFLIHFMSRFDDMESEPTDCFSACGIKYLYTRSTEKKEHFRKIIKSTGGKDEGVAVIYKQDFYCATPTGRYCIDTSNGTCFINGLCQARKPINMLNRLVKYHKTFGPKIDSVFAGIFARYAEGADDLIPDDHIEDVSSAALLKELTENSAVIEIKKNYLNSTDYKAMKYAEGVLPEEEWLPIKAKRAEAREEINNMEARNAEIIPILKEANPCLMKEYGDKYWWVKKNRKEMLDFADLNNMLEDVREYFNAQG